MIAERIFNYEIRWKAFPFRVILFSFLFLFFSKFLFHPKNPFGWNRAIDSISFDILFWSEEEKKRKETQFSSYLVYPYLCVAANA